MIPDRPPHGSGLWPPGALAAVTGMDDNFAPLQTVVNRVGLDRFLPFIMAAAQGLPESMALAYIREACIDFCEKSSILRRRIFITTQPRVHEYPLLPDDDERLIRVDEVSLGRRRFRLHRDRTVFLLHGMQATVRDGRLALSFVPFREALTPPPWDDWRYRIEVRATVAPTHDACAVDEILLHDWEHAIEDGALARIYMLPGYKFSSPQLAGVREQSFSEGIRRARVRGITSDTSADIFATAMPIV